MYLDHVWMLHGPCMEAQGLSTFNYQKFIPWIINKTPAKHQDIFRLQLANNKHVIEFTSF